MLVLICFAAPGLNQGYCFCPQEKDEDQLILDLEKNIAEQEKLLGVLRARYAKLLSRKKQLLEWIEQEKEKLRQQEASLSRQKVPVKLPPAKVSSEGKAEPEIRAGLSQPDLAGGKSEKLQDSKDIKRLDFLIKRQKKLSAEIIKLEIKISAEENKIKTLKESLKTLKNP
jgi:hypothetical protein